MSETTIAVIIGALVILAPNVPWKDLLGKLNIFKDKAKETPVKVALDAIRQHLALRDKTVRTRGFDAVDILAPIVNFPPEEADDEKA